MSEELKKEYEILAKKYSLPDFDELNNEFDTYRLEAKLFLLREIRLAIVEKFEKYTSLLSGILQPDPSSLSELLECRAFEDKEKEKVFQIYKQMMAIERESLIVSLNAAEKEDAKFIIYSFDEWCRLKADLAEIISKIKGSWEQEADIHNEQGYMG